MGGFGEGSVDGEMWWHNTPKTTKAKLHSQSAILLCTKEVLIYLAILEAM